MRANYGVSFVSWKLGTMYMFCFLCAIAVFNVILTRSNGTPIHLGVMLCCGVSCGTISTASNSKDHRRGQLWKKHNSPQITSLTIVYSTVYFSTDQRKHQSSAWLAFVRGIHRWQVNSPHKGPVMWTMFPFDDVIMNQYGQNKMYMETWLF